MREFLRSRDAAFCGVNKREQKLEAIQTVRAFCQQTPAAVNPETLATVTSELGRENSHYTRREGGN